MKASTNSLLDAVLNVGETIFRPLGESAATLASTDRVPGADGGVGVGVGGTTPGNMVTLASFDDKLTFPAASCAVTR